jgi:hypothetical protein
VDVVIGTPEAVGSGIYGGAVNGIHVDEVEEASTMIGAGVVEAGHPKRPSDAFLLVDHPHHKLQKFRPLEHL